MHNITETIFTCHGVITLRLDLVKEDYQVYLEEDSKDYTAFSAVISQYQS